MIDELLYGIWLKDLAFDMLDDYLNKHVGFGKDSDNDLLSVTITVIEERDDDDGVGNE